MNRLRQYSNLVRAIAFWTAASFLAACTQWKPEPLQPAHFQSPNNRQMLRITTRQGSTMYVRSPVISGDTLIGQQRIGEHQFATYQPVRLALDSVDHAERDRFSAGRTVLFFAGLGLVALIVKGGQSVSYPSCVFNCPTQ